MQSSFKLFISAIRILSILVAAIVNVPRVNLVNIATKPTLLLHALVNLFLELVYMSMVEIAAMLFAKIVLM